MLLQNCLHLLPLFEFRANCSAVGGSLPFSICSCKICICQCVLCLQIWYISHKDKSFHFINIAIDSIFHLLFFSHRELNVGLGCSENSFYKEMILRFYKLALLGPADKHEDPVLAIYYYTSQIIHLCTGDVSLWVEPCLERSQRDWDLSDLSCKALSSIPGWTWCHMPAIPELGQ